VVKFLNCLFVFLSGMGGGPSPIPIYKWPVY
jgi:hypothetical protein